MPPARSGAADAMRSLRLTLLAARLKTSVDGCAENALVEGMLSNEASTDRRSWRSFGMRNRQTSHAECEPICHAPVQSIVRRLK